MLARKLGENGFGVFTFGFALATLVTALAGFGQDVVLIREIARDRERLHRYFFNTLALKSALALPALVVTTAVASLVGVDAETRWVVLLLGVAVMLDLLTLTCISVFQAFERLVYMPVVLVTQRGVTAIVGIAALLGGAGVVAVSAVYAAVALLAFVLATAIVYTRIRRPRLVVDTSFWWPFMRIAAPIGLTAVFGTVLFRVDTTILASLGTKQEVGEYGAAFRLFETTLFLSWSVGTAVYPVLSRLTRESDPPLHAIFDRAVKLVLAVAVPLAVAAAVLAEPLVDLIYGSEFDETPEALVLLAPAIALYPIAHVAGVLLYGRDRAIPMVVVYGVGAVANVALNLVLISRFGIQGAATAASLTWLYLAVTLLLLAIRTAGTFEARRVFGGPVAAAAPASLALAVLADNLFAAIAAAAAIYATALTVWERRLYPDDARALADFVTRRR